MREQQEHDKRRQPSIGETYLGLMIAVALALGIWLFVDEPKDTRVNTVFEPHHSDVMQERTTPPEG
jgi:hypothetical protein